MYIKKPVSHHSSAPIKLMKNVVTFYDTILNDRLSVLDITAAQTIITAYFSESERDGRSVCQRDVENEFLLSNPTVVGLLKRMQSKGIIEKTPSETDRRSNTIRLTQKGRELQPRLAVEMLAMQDILLQGLSEQDKDNLIRILSVMINNLINYSKKGWNRNEPEEEAD